MKASRSSAGSATAHGHQRGDATGGDNTPAIGIDGACCPTAGLDIDVLDVQAGAISV